VGYDTITWHVTNVPGNGTVLAALEYDGYYEYDLYQMDNLKRVDSSLFDSPWWFRKEFDGP
jgi:hypothetical protein